MDLDTLRNICNSLPHVTEDVKWQNDLCFLLGGKIFCITGFSPPLRVSLKVNEEEFEELCTQRGIMPAPYLAKYKWVLLGEDCGWKRLDWERYVKNSYELIKAKLPKKILVTLK